ncbi:RNA-binding protein lark-like isoform X2 [Tigriopus californicus]|uniref:RNA-binding protein lark-like isoform X2 n=1 Tax=Tigriopus californicus TaxID=6832 RepID=UPI0027D9F1F7|nr:RNA-binding protein lark-like isoform X2 [Tigriopus californicus]
MKIYVGNLGDDDLITAQDLKPLFEPYGTVTECEKIKNYAFVHVEEESGGEKAVRELHNTPLKGREIRVEKSETRGPRNPSHKLFVGNLPAGTTAQDIRDLFTDHAPVIEADVIKNYAFVHLDAALDAARVTDLIRQLNGHQLQGHTIRVQMSVSDSKGGGGGGGRRESGVRSTAKEDCFRCGGRGHWSRECPSDFDSRSDRRSGGRGPPPRRDDRYDGGGRMRGADPYRPRDRADPYPSRSAPRDRYDEPMYRRESAYSAPAPREPYERRSYGGGPDDYYGGSLALPPRRPEPFGEAYPPAAPVRYGTGGYAAPGYASGPSLDLGRSGGYDSGASSGTAPAMVPYSRRPAVAPAPAFPGSMGGYPSASGVSYGFFGVFTE